MPPWFTPFRLAFIACILDLLWALQAMAQVPRHATSTVSVVSLTLWLLFHLPAAALAGALLKVGGLAQVQAGDPSVSTCLLTGALGLSQTFGLVYGLASWRRRSP